MNIIRKIESVQLSYTDMLLVENGCGRKPIDEVNYSLIEYNSDGYIVNGYIAEPKDASLKYPLVLWNRGGDNKRGRLDNFLAALMLGEIASWGYVVVASQYRNEEEFGGKEINDIMNILKIGMEHPLFDGENVGVEGWSRGGMMTYQLLTKINFFKCATVIAGLADLKSNFERNYKLKDMFYALFRNADENRIRQEINKRSAVKFYRDISPDVPLMLIHGTNDESISYDDSENLYHKLSSIDRAEVTLIPIEFGDHYLRRHRKIASKLRKEWLDKYLKLNS